MESDGDEEYTLCNDIFVKALLYDKGLASIASFVGTDQKKVRLYPMKQPLGFAILLASDRTPEHGPQNSFHKDLKLMEMALIGCQWAIESPCLVEGSTEVFLGRNQFDNILERLLARSGNLEQYSCFMFYYSGHGASDCMVLSDGGRVPYKDIVISMSSIPCLKGKPKIFIFDCCRVPPTNKSHEDTSFFQSSFSFDLENINFSRSEGYPPDHCIIAFSAAEDTAAVGLENAPSIFTLLLAHALAQFRCKLSFGEILTQVAGGTKIIAQMVERKQKPVYQSTLTALLVLNENTKKKKKAFNQSYEVVYEDSADFTAASKGGGFEKGMYKPDTQHRSPERDRVTSPVLTDQVVGHVPTFRSKEDVVSNLSRLGEGKSVFVCYAPDPESPYYDHREREAEIHRNEIRLASLILDLELHGFHVVSDLHMKDTEPVDFLQWYITRISYCNSVILVCSPAFYEIFSCEQPKAEISDKRAQLLFTYKRTVYGEIVKEVTTQGNVSRFIPVILESCWDTDQSVPLLFQGGHVYRLFETEQRQFDYDDLTRDFEKLTCRMAGINRMELNKPQERTVHMLAGPHESGESRVYTQPPQLTKPKGYRSVPSRVGQRPQYVLSPPSSLQSEASGIAPHFAQPTPMPVDLHSQQSYPQPILPVASINPPHPFPLQPILPVASINPPHPFPLQPILPVSSINPPHPSPRLPVPAIQPALPNYELHPLPQPDLASLPERPLDDRIVLWLSHALTSWKFIGRFLGIEAPDIHRIQYENQFSFTEQCFAMIQTWQQRRPLQYNYRVFGEALWKDEKGRTLYQEYARKVLELET